MNLNHKTQLLNKLNNKSLNRNGSDKLVIAYTNDTLKYLKILYSEGRILSFYRKNDKLIAFVNFESNFKHDKVLFEKQKYKPSVKYKNLAEVRSSLKTMYFHTSQCGKLLSLLTLEEVKQRHVGGIPVFFV